MYGPYDLLPTQDAVTCALPDGMLPRYKVLPGCKPCVARLDSLGFTTGLAITIAGVSIGLQTNDATLLGRLPDYFPPGWRSCMSHEVDQLYSIFVPREPAGQRLRRYSLLYRDVSRLARTIGFGTDNFEVMEASMVRTVSRTSKDFLFVRGGVVGWEGQAIMVVGPPGSGRTTFIKELVGAGAQYYSDQFAVFDREGLVHPFPTPIYSSNGTDACRRICPTQYHGSTPLRLGRVLVTHYEPGARWRPRPLTQGQAMLAIMEWSINADRWPMAVGSLCHAVLRSSAFKGKRGEAASVVPELLGCGSAA